MSEDDTLEVNCGKHGKRVAAVVCGHLLKENDTALGFIENSSEPGDYQGWCYECEELFLKEEELTDKFREFNDMSIVCEECYFAIKSKHEREP